MPQDASSPSDVGRVQLRVNQPRCTRDETYDHPMVERIGVLLGGLGLVLAPCYASGPPAASMTGESLVLAALGQVR